MPSYNEITDALLNMWAEYIDELSENMYKCVNRMTVRYFIIELYEYISVIIAYRNHHDNGRKNFETSWTVIKKVIEEPWRIVLKDMMFSANMLRHNGCYPIDSKGKDFGELACWGKFIRVPDYIQAWNEFLVKTPKAYKLMTDYARLRVIEKELKNDSQLRRDCIDYASICLHVDESTGYSDKTVGETIDAVADNFMCSKGYATEIVDALIKNDRKVK